ncbi:MAG: hypothetical protein UU21_C0003G0001 [Candidatus Levybacteria bacterium GW2011_GWA2_40_8]|nr:MAG: hypothetical protein UU21_C0003G0001 [Candidatus Levybacteria bacterium GW2011_GWA2_40_8]
MPVNAEPIPTSIVPEAPKAPAPPTVENAVPSAAATDIVAEVEQIVGAAPEHTSPEDVSEGLAAIAGAPPDAIPPSAESEIISPPSPPAETEAPDGAPQPDTGPEGDQPPPPAGDSGAAEAGAQDTDSTQTQEGADTDGAPPKSDEDASRVDFGLVAKAKAEFAQAEEDGTLTPQKKEELLGKIREAEKKEALLEESRHKVELRGKGRFSTLRARINRRLGRETGAGAVILEHRKFYDKVLFEPLREASKKPNAPSYDTFLEGPFQEARQMRIDAKTALNEARKGGDQDAIAMTQIKYDAISEYYSTILWERRKAKLKQWNFKKLLLAIGLSFLMDTFRQSRDSAYRQTKLQQQQAS